MTTPKAKAPGLKLAVICPYRESATGGITYHARILADHLAAQAAVLPLFRPRFAAGSASAVARQAAEEGCNGAILQYTPNLYGWRNPFPWLCLRALRRRRIRTLLFCHELFLPEYPTWTGRFLARPFNYLKDRLCLAAADGVAVTSRLRQRFLKDRLSLNPLLAPAYSNLPVYTGPSLKPDCLFGFFGTGHPDVNLGAMREAMAAFPGRRMLWIGSLPEHRRFPGLDCTGPQSGPEAASALRRVRFFLLCDRRGLSFRKGSSAAALQAGLPLLANPSEWTEEEFVNDVNVRFHDGTAGGIVAAARALEDNPALRQKIASGGRALYERVLDPGRAAQQVLSFFRGEVP